MNKDRRKHLTEISVKLQELKEELEQVREEEQEYFDNMHENLQDGEKGRRAEEVVQFLDDADADLAVVVENVEGATE